MRGTSPRMTESKAAAQGDAEISAWHEILWLVTMAFPWTFLKILH
jgi:hypothetical protein